MNYRDGVIDGVIFRSLDARGDRRGWLIELFRIDELPEAFTPAMAYVSETLPGVTRGPHEHRDQTDCFAFIGPGEFRIYLWDARPESPTQGNRLVREAGASSRQMVIVPPGVVHAYRNIGGVSGWVFNAPNRLYAGPGRREPVDEIRHEEATGHPFVLE